MRNTDRLLENLVLLFFVSVLVHIHEYTVSTWQFSTQLTTPITCRGSLVKLGEVLSGGPIHWKKKIVAFSKEI